MTAQIPMVAIAFVLCLHFIVVSPFPTSSWSTKRPVKHTKWMWARQERQPPQAQVDSWVANRSPETKDTKANDDPYHLPHVSQVFKMMADLRSRQSVKPTMTRGHIPPTTTPQVLVVPPSPAVPSAPNVAAALAPTTTIVQSSSLASYPATGLSKVASQTMTPEAHAPQQPAVVTGSFASTGSSFPSEGSWTDPSDITGVSHSKASDTVSSMGPIETGTTLDAVKPTSADAVSPHGTASRLVMVGVMIASLIALMFLVYFILNYRLFAFCRRKKEAREEADAWTKIASPPPPGTYQGAEKEIVYETPGSERSASSVYSTHNSEGSALESNTRLDSTVPDEVIDISSNYPRSKFSLCSSEYPPSISSQSSTFSVRAPLDGKRIDSSTLLPPYEFFCQPPEFSEDTSRHSRAHSEPVFFHPDANREAPQLLLRAIQHRRSRSISGLTYTVKSEQRESGSSAGDWVGSPQSPSGWPTAL